MAKSIVGKFNDDFSKIEFYEILFSYKNITFIKEQSLSSYRYYAYDNKSGKIGKLPIYGDLKAEDVQRILPITKVIWLREVVLFFWADSVLVNSYGLEYYDRLLSLYKELLLIKSNEFNIIDNKDKLLDLKFIPRMIMKYRIFRTKMQRIKIFSKMRRELKIIW